MDMDANYKKARIILNLIHLHNLLKRRIKMQYQKSLGAI